MSQTPPSAAAHRQAAMTTRAAMAAWADAAASAGRDDLDGHVGRDDSDGRDVTRDGLADARFGLRCLRRDGVDSSAGADGDHGRHGAAGPAGRDNDVSGADGDRGRHGDDDPTRSWGRNGAGGSTLESSLTLRDWDERCTMLGPRICDRCQVPLDDDEDLSICCNCFRRLCWVCSESCFRCAMSFCHNFCPCLCRVGALNRGNIDVTENEVRGYECASGGTLATNASGPHCDTVLCSLRKSRPSSRNYSQQ